MAIQVTWLGHSALQILIGDHRVLIDPFLTGNPLAATRPDDLDIDFILLTHGHDDHLGDTVAIARRTGAMVVTNFEIGNWLRDQHGLERLHSLNCGGGVRLPFGRVEFTPALHSSSLPDGTYGGLASGILIFTNEGRTIFDAGDTAPFQEMQWIGDREIDLALLPIGDYYTMGAAGSLKAIELLRPKAVIPIHYNTYDLIAQDVVGWAQRVHNETNAKPVVLDPGGSYEL
jgi:L-ascorbate metabolism protein UlaG (beta-lactamase superfamily)